MKTAVLSPHLDDAVLSCWHVLTGPAEVVVVNVFTGMPKGDDCAWWDSFTGAASSQTRMRDRLAEDGEALRLAGRTAINLDFLDSQYRNGPQDVAAITDRLAGVLDSVTRVYSPASLGGLADHAIVRSAAQLLEQRGYEVRLYADLPHALSFGWPPAGADVHTLDDPARAAKLAAIRTYRTQLDALTTLHPGLTEPETLRYEATWR